jgi:hypothetical protein
VGVGVKARALVFGVGCGGAEVEQVSAKTVPGGKNTPVSGSLNHPAPGIGPDWFEPGEEALEPRRDPLHSRVEGTRGGTELYRERAHDVTIGFEGALGCPSTLRAEPGFVDPVQDAVTDEADARPVRAHGDSGAGEQEAGEPGQETSVDIQREREDAAPVGRGEHEPESDEKDRRVSLRP